MPGGRNATQRKDAAARIRSLIEDGRFAVGTPLPSERELARLLDLPQPTIHRAITGLERSGVLAPAAGRQRLVRSPEPGTLQRTVVILSTGHTAKHVDSGAFSDNLVQQAHERAVALGLSSLAFDPRRLDEPALARLIAGQPLGVIVPDRGFEQVHDRHILEALHNARIPIASADYSGGGPPCDLALSDQAAGATLLVHWLHARGCQRLATAWAADTCARWWYAPRQAGYDSAMRSLGLAPLPPLLAAPMPSRINVWDDRRGAKIWCEEQGRHWVGWLIEAVRRDHIEAILAGDDSLAIAVRHALAILGSATVQVVGYDANAAAGPLAAEGLLPVASIDKRYGLIGETLVDLVAERRDGRLSGPPTIRLVAPELVAYAAARRSLATGSGSSSVKTPAPAE